MSLNLYPDIIFEEDLSPDFEEVDDTCEAIYTACKGWGTDESGLIQALGTKTPEERYKIYYRYKELKGKDLRDLIKSECGSRSFGRALQLLSYPPDVAECKMIRLAADGAGTDEELLYPILCGRSNADVDMLKKTFYKFYDKDLSQKLNSELSGDLERLVFNALQGIEEEYDPEHHTPEKAEEDAVAFYEAGQGSWGTDEASLFKILCASPPQHLEAVNDVYTDKYGYTLFKAMEKEMGGTTEQAVLFALGMKLKPYETVAALIKKACAGFGTNELALTCCLIRYQKILGEVKVAHEELYEKTLLERVKSETSGDYGKLLCLLVESAE